MDFLLKLALFIFVIWVVILLVRRWRDRPAVERKEIPPYVLCPAIFNGSERVFFLELTKQLPTGYHIFPKVRMIDYIKPVDEWSYAIRNKIWNKHVDFLICNKDFKPVLAVEINGKSHQRTDRVARDLFVRNVYAAVGLPIVFVEIGTNFQEAIRQILEILVGAEKTEKP